MKKEITVGQLLSAVVSIILTIAAAWITLEKKVTENEVRMKMMEAQIIDDRIQYRKSIDEVKWQVQDGNKDIRDILIDLQRKQNRK